MKYLFRVDASQTLGTGHIRRCIVLASELAKLGAEIGFISSQETISYFKDVDFPSYAIPNFVDQDSDARHSQKYIDSDSEIIVDHYQLDLRWEKNFKKISAIDDLNRKHQVDFLIDQNYRSSYDSLYADSQVGVAKLLGPKYCILNSAFVEVRKNIAAYQERPKKLFVCYGGGETSSYLKKFLATKVNWPASVVSGQYETVLQKKDSIEFFINSKNIAKLMAQSQIALGAGGTMHWERLSLGLPSIVTPIAENQVKISQELANAGYIRLLDNLELLSNTLKDFIHDVNLRVAMSQKAMQLVDAKGAKRIASKLISRNITFTAANEDDCERIFEWRNYELNRKYSSNPELIEFSTHQVWFAKALKQSKILIANLDNVELAVVRFDFSDKAAEISLYLLPGFHGRGFGLAILLAALDWFESNHSKTHLEARILPENMASLSIFNEAGFVFFEHLTGGETVFVRAGKSCSL